MPLTLREIGLFDFRSFAARSIELAGGLTILCGANATGKTNTVEALQLLTAGTSFRNPRTSDLVRDGADSAKVTGRIEGDGRVIDVELIVESGRKRFRRNGKPARPQDLSSTLMSVLFTPDDLQLVKAGALESWKSGGTRMVSLDSVECRLAEERKAGRPRKDLATA